MSLEAILERIAVALEKRAAQMDVLIQQSAESVVLQREALNAYPGASYSVTEQEPDVATSTTVTVTNTPEPISIVEPPKKRGRKPGNTTEATDLPTPAAPAPVELTDDELLAALGGEPEPAPAPTLPAVTHDDLVPLMTQAVRGGMKTLDLKAAQDKVLKVLEGRKLLEIAPEDLTRVHAGLITSLQAADKAAAAEQAA